MEVHDFAPLPTRDLVAAAIDRVPPRGQVHLQGPLAAALLPELLSFRLNPSRDYLRLLIPDDSAPI